jgi:hypothetical protein
MSDPICITVGRPRILDGWAEPPGENINSLKRETYSEQILLTYITI